MFTNAMCEETEHFITLTFKNTLCIITLKAKILAKNIEISSSKYKKVVIFLINSYHIVLSCFFCCDIHTSMFYFREKLCQQIVMEGEWYTSNSIEETLNLLRGYETNSITKFSCYSSDREFEKLMSSIFERVKRV